MEEHVFLVAVVVRTDQSREQAEFWLHEALNMSDFRGKVGDDTVPHVDSWWIAEDDRHDRSDCDSAVFVIPGQQRNAVGTLRDAGLAY